MGQPLHLKYRPKKLDDVIGQDVAVKILKNSLESGNIANAFLFTGSRGLGKTSLARILAKSVNCEVKIGPSPCGMCSSCLSIEHGEHVDVLEMDAASRTGVDDIRGIIEDSSYIPVSARYKVYILDEAHMLSKSAFNALLKTLEETPERVKFILATTETQKLPLTVVSRCQRFALRKLTVPTMIEHLQRVLNAEGVVAERGALEIVAHAAQGSVRDALSLLEQLIMFNSNDAQVGKPIAAIQAESMLGLPGNVATEQLLNLILAKNCREAISLVTEQHYRGGSTQLLHSLLSLIHDKMLQNLGSPETFCRLWELTLRAIEDVDRAPDELHAVSVSVVRMIMLHDVSGGKSSDLKSKTSSNEQIGTYLAPIAVPSDEARVDEQIVSNDGFCVIMKELMALADTHKELAVSRYLRHDVMMDSLRDGYMEVSTQTAHKALAHLLPIWTNKQWEIRMSDGLGVSAAQRIAELERGAVKKILRENEVASGLMQEFNLKESDVEIVGGGYGE